MAKKRDWPRTISQDRHADLFDPLHKLVRNEVDDFLASLSERIYDFELELLHQLDYRVKPLKQRRSTEQSLIRSGDLRMYKQS